MHVDLVFDLVAGFAEIGLRFPPLSSAGSGGSPGLAGTDHVGFTVPDIEAATRFFGDVIGCTLVFEIGPFKSDDDWMRTQVGVDRRAVIRKLRTFRCETGPSFEISEYQSDGASALPPATAIRADPIWASTSRTSTPRSLAQECRRRSRKTCVTA
jgi:hypothetical protein